MTRFFNNNMKLSFLAAAVTLAALASAQAAGGSSSGGGYGAGGGASGGAGGGMSGGGASGGGAGGGAPGPGAAMMMIPPSILAFFNRVQKATIAHGVLMCLAFVIFFPTGSILIRLGHFKGVVYVHAGIQIFAYMMALAGMGLGAYVCHAPTVVGRENQIHKYHPIIGVTIMVALVFQPIFGSLHHSVYVREGRRSIWSTLHVWWGRLFLTFAFIQGGLGLRFANNTTGGKIAYGVVAGIVWVTWMGVAIWHDFVKKSQPPEAQVMEKRADSEEGTPARQ